MNIEHVATTILASEELATLAGRIHGLILEASLEASFLQASLQLIQGDIDRLNAALSKERGSSLSQQISEQDDLRDRVFMGFRCYLESYTFHWDQPLAQAADGLLQTFRKHGTRLHREGNTIQTTKMKLLIADLEVDEATNQLNLLKADFWLNKMKQENTTFEELVQARNEEQSSKDSPLIREQKVTLGQNLNKLLSVLELMMASTPSTQLEDLIKQINEAIVPVMATARRRKSSTQASTEA